MCHADLPTWRLPDYLKYKDIFKVLQMKRETLCGKMKLSLSWAAPDKRKHFDSFVLQVVKN
jgi:hypothetical protein